MKIQRTERGFEIGTWQDANGMQCELQQSSATGDHCGTPPGASFVWLGGRLEGDYGSHRMHLSREQVTELYNRLDTWLKTGSFLFTAERLDDVGN